MSTNQDANWMARIALSLAALVIAGCLELRKSEPQRDNACTACHGDEHRSGETLSRSAPPRDLDGHTTVDAPGVGAHARHLEARGHASVACAECHVVPDSVFSRGHVDSAAPAELVFGALASRAEGVPSFDRGSGNCSDTYCHGAAAVNWTKPRDARAACGTCHGLPPKLPHPQRQNCDACHGEVIDERGEFIAPERHVDGVVDVKVRSNCAACHGSDPDTGSPPPDLLGNLEPSSRGVGAHAAHLSASSTHAAVGCGECHRVPTEPASPGHIDEDGRAEVVFGELANSHGSQGIYSSDQGSCLNTY